MLGFVMRRVIFFSMMALAAGLLWLVKGIDHAVNYTQVAARVDGIERSCFRSTGSAADFSTGENPRDNMDCADVRTGVVKTKVTIHLRYMSPVDNQEHNSDLRLIDYRKPLPEKGSTWDVLASKSDAGKVITL